MELVDIADLKSAGFGRTGSSPVLRTIRYRNMLREIGLVLSNLQELVARRLRGTGIASVKVCHTYGLLWFFPGNIGHSA